MNHNIEFQKVLLMDFPLVQDKQLSLTKFLGTESPQDRCYCTRIPMMSYALLCVECILRVIIFHFFGICKKLIDKKTITILHCPLCPYVCRNSLEL